MNAQNTYPNPRKHPFTEMGYGPIFDEKSKVLILGSFPPINTSEKNGFYYGAKNNKFWFVLGLLFDDPNLQDKTRDEKAEFLCDKKIALWDIWASCYKKDPKNGSDGGIIADKSQPVDLTELFEKAKIQKIFTTIDKGCFKTWRIEDWLWDGVKYGEKKYGGYAKYFSHCKTKSEIVVSLYSTSFRSRYAKQNGCPKLLADYRQIKEIVEG